MEYDSTDSDSVKATVDGELMRKAGAAKEAVDAIMLQKKKIHCLRIKKERVKKARPVTAKVICTFYYSFVDIDSKLQNLSSSRNMQHLKEEIMTAVSARVVTSQSLGCCCLLQAYQLWVTREGCDQHLNCWALLCLPFL
ncbi:hypothetical protein POM88_030075 [Heracleum sosnowskyi]|uniref:Uncharacterized protein n=1 Tax=Heracleum sosnowskyi TaxID=360622 RepID=A0AAD8HUW5_9APIA|nr:hypothetical protein POM88_030075 [Heracleum sosnowskyi]